MRSHLRKVLSIAFVSSLAATASGCAPSETEPTAPSDATTSSVESEIVGGTLANGHPAVVAIAMQGQGFCTGTLISPQTILTAGHCVMEGSNFQAVFGSRIDQAQKAVEIEGFVRHPGFSTTQGMPVNDIAVAKLAEPVTDIQPIGIIQDEIAADEVGESIRHVGFGLTSASERKSGNTFGVKRQVTFPIRELAESQLEAGADGKQTCMGDSGGPGLMVRPGSNEEKVVGVVSFGDAECLRGGVDTRVDFFREWVETTSAQWEGAEEQVAAAAL